MIESLEAPPISSPAPGDALRLDRIRIVLVAPSHPGNVGATARAMKVMGLSHLALVAPRYADVLGQPDAIAFAIPRSHCTSSCSSRARANRRRNRGISFFGAPGSR